ncbi:hypothetical protein LAJ19_16020 (plasmid) [Deinococcus taeanensis]|uniref:hypothetical protein n=1 Tax=Deinococcus taeanensis TaxID=2737050 RepID=UPI001CDBEB7E|nr:hypothetical protein [Deinococcus taeanensis]UBV44670.1 hypothetical protein LAJ19_16020 [Deinococcus taeanensis]
MPESSRPAQTTLGPERTTAALDQPRRPTSDELGAQRVAFTGPWQAARDFLREKLTALPVTVDTDPSGKLWPTLPGESDQEVWSGGDLDSVPDGGWLDGYLNVFAGREVLRRLHAQNACPPPGDAAPGGLDRRGEPLWFGGTLYAPNAGRDMLGNLPPESFFRLKAGGNHGRPQILRAASDRPAH